jgi:dipeptidyl aminopeptidase/acylaminoacyl peptidase
MHDPGTDYCERDQAGQEFLCPSDIYVMDADGSNVDRLTTDDAAEFQPVWSPVGDRIAFVRPEHQTGNEYLGIFSMNTDGSDVRRVSSSDGGSDFSPTWAPDGSQIAFVGLRWEDWAIWVADADGTAEHEIEFEGEFNPWFNNRPVWSPDGTSIVSVCRGAGEGDVVALCLVRPDGANLSRITAVPYEAGGIAWRPAPMTGAPVDVSATPDPVPAEPTAVDARVSTTGAIAPFPSGIAAGEGGIWVGAGRNDGSGAGDVVRLDPLTGEIVARIPVRSLPGWEFGAAGITVGLGSIWVVGGTPEGEACCSALVSRIDPSTNALIDEIAIPGVLFGADVWVDETGLYILSFHENEPTLDLASLDPETHEVRWRVSLPAQWSQTVFVSGGSVWALGTAPDARGPVEVNTLYRVDPGDGDIVAEIPLRNSMYAPAAAPGVLWLRTLDGAQRFDPVTAQPIGEPIEPAPGCCTGAFVADGSGGVWVISSPGVDSQRGVWHIDASGRIVEAGEVADREQFQQMLGQGYAFDPVTRTIWVQHYEDSVSRVELVPVGGS